VTKLILILTRKMPLLVSRLNDLKECEEIRTKFFEIVFGSNKQFVTEMIESVAEARSSKLRGHICFPFQKYFYDQKKKYFYDQKSCFSNGTNCHTSTLGFLID